MENWFKERLNSLLDNLVFAGIMAGGVAVMTYLMSLPTPVIIVISTLLFVLIILILRLLLYTLKRNSKLNATLLQDIKADLVNMNKCERQVATKKSKQMRPKGIAIQIHDDVSALFPVNKFLSIIQKAKNNDIDPMVDFFKKFGEILDKNDYGLKSELGNNELYESSRTDLAQKRLKLKMRKKRETTIGKNIDRVRAITYGLNSSIRLRHILKSMPLTKGIPLASEVIICLESIETVTEIYLNEMLSNLENEWTVTINQQQMEDIEGKMREMFPSINPEQVLDREDSQN